MLVVAVFCVASALVATAVIALRWHYFTDTVAGAAVAVATVCGLALLLDRPTARRWLVRPSRQPSAVRERQSHPSRADAGASV